METTKKPPPPPLDTSSPATASPSTPSSSRATRRKSALVNVVRRMNSASLPIERPPSDINQLVRIYLLDGSSKVIQVKESSSVWDVLLLLKYNLELSSVRDHAIYMVTTSDTTSSSKRLDLHERIKAYSEQCSAGGATSKLLFRSWIYNPVSKYTTEVMQHNKNTYTKQPTSALWLRWLEVTMMLSVGNYHLSEEEALIVGSMKLQADSGNSSSLNQCSISTMAQRIAATFPPPLRQKMRHLLQEENMSQAEEIVKKVFRLHRNLMGQSRPSVQINMLRFLSTVCPLFGSVPIPIEVQYDSNPSDTSAEPPVIPMNLHFTPTAIYLVSSSSLLRQPYENILRFNTFEEHNILCYYIVKEGVNLSSVKYDSSSSTDLLAKYCDCVYLVSPTVCEIEFLLETHMRLSGALTDDHIGKDPCLPGYEESDAEEESPDAAPNAKEENDKPQDATRNESTESSTSTPMRSKNRRSSGFSLLLRALSLQAGEETATEDDVPDRRSSELEDHTMEPPSSTPHIDDRINGSIFRSLFAEQQQEVSVATSLAELTKAAQKDFMEEIESGNESDSASEESKVASFAAEPEKRSKFFKWAQI